MDDKNSDKPNEKQDSLGRSIDMGDLKGEFGKRSGDDPSERSTLSVDFGDLKNELDKRD